MNWTVVLILVHSTEAMINITVVPDAFIYISPITDFTFNL